MSEQLPFTIKDIQLRLGRPLTKVERKAYAEAEKLFQADREKKCQDTQK